MNKTTTAKIEPHIDVADLYHYFDFEQKDFFSEKDIPVTLDKLLDAGIKVLGTTLYFDESFVKTNFYDGVNTFFCWYEELFETTDHLVNIKTVEEISNKDNVINCFYTIEGFECLRSPADFDYFYDLGVRSFGLTWEKDNKYAGGRHGKGQGITRLGKEVLQRMEKRNLIVDIAHLGEKSVMELGEFFNGMIVTTHGNLRSVHQTNHNLRDEEVDLIVERGGVVSLFPLAEDTGHKGTIEEFYHHIEYLGEKWGEDYIAISSDIYPLDEYPFLNNAQDVLILNQIEEYLRTRLDSKAIEKIFYKNWQRVLASAL